MAGRIPQHFIDDLLARIDVVDIIDAYVPLKKAGRNYQALCPFHDEKTPSFSVSQEKQFYHCFGCGANGTAISFLMEYLHLEFLDAIEELASKAGLEIPREAGPAGPSPSQSAELYELMDMVVQLYRKNLRKHNQSEKAVNYLKDRGISGEIAGEFELGYAASGWDNIIKELGGSNAALERLFKIGMVLKNDRGGYYDRFRDRIMFPIRDQRGRAIGLGGRVLGDDTPKYLNSPETPIFHKGQELYGLYQAKKAIKDLDSLYIVEGYIDVIALAQFGIRNVVATLGTAATREHIEKLFRSTSKIIFCFDGDRAGKKAAHKAMGIALPLLHDGRQIFFRFIPEEEDPDSYIRNHGKEQFEDPDQLTPLSEYLLSIVQQDLSPAIREDKDKLIKRADSYLENMPQSSLKQLIIQKLSRLTDLEEQIIEARYKKNKNQPGRQYKPSAKSDLNPMTSAIACLLRRPALIAGLDINHDLEKIEINGHDFFKEIIQFIQDNPDVSTAGIIEHWRGTNFGQRLSELAPVDSPYGGEDENLYGDEDIKLNFCAAIEKMISLTKKQKLKNLAGIKSVSELTKEHLDLLPTLPDKK